MTQLVSQVDINQSAQPWYGYQFSTKTTIAFEYTVMVKLIVSVIRFVVHGFVCESFQIRLIEVGGTSYREASWTKGKGKTKQTICTHPSLLLDYGSNAANDLKLLPRRLNINCILELLHILIHTHICMNTNLYQKEFILELIRNFINRKKAKKVVLYIRYRVGYKNAYVLTKNPDCEL